MPKKSIPNLSVVIVILGGRQYIPRCLNALNQQKNAPSMEIIIPCDDRISDLNLLRREFPHVSFIEAKGRLTYAELRAIGFGAAVGDVIALTEDHCLPDPAWSANIMSEHRNGVAALGGPVDKKDSDSILNWAVYLSDFSRYMNPVTDGPSEYLTDCNVSYKRQALEEVADLWKDEFHETTVNWALKDRGKKLRLSHNVVVNQQRSLSYQAALRERYAFGRLFASTRVAATGAAKRLFYALFSVLLPFLFVARVAKNVFQKRRAIGRFVLTAPVIFLLGIFWALGEFVGYLSGRPEASLNPDF